MIYFFICGLFGVFVIVIVKGDDVGSVKLRYVLEVFCRKRDYVWIFLIVKG